MIVPMLKHLLPSCKKLAVCLDAPKKMRLPLHAHGAFPIGAELSVDFLSEALLPGRGAFRCAEGVHTAKDTSALKAVGVLLLGGHTAKGFFGILPVDPRV